MTSRRLPRTDTIMSKENAALRNKVKCLEDSLQQAYRESSKGVADDVVLIENLQKENASLKREKSLSVKTILEY